MLYSFDQFALDTDRFELCRDGKAVRAEPQVIELLVYFLENPDRLVTRDELIRAVWKGRTVSDSAVSGRIKMARKTLGDDGRRQRYIRTVHSKGFTFTADGLKADVDITAAQSSGIGPAAGRQRVDTKPSVGVLKFNNLGHDNAQRYFAEGITEDLITTLSKISKLIVVAHPESPKTDHQAVNARQAGVELGVGHVLYGSVRSDAERLRISVHLLETGSGRYIWTQRYDGPNRKLFDLQDEITKQVVSALQVELTEGDQALLLSRGTDQIEAWQLTFQGQAAVLEHHQDSVRRGLQQLEQALGLDPDYALAWSSLAVAHWKESLNEGWSDSREASLRLAVEASDRALALQPDDAGILAMRSLILVSLRRFDEALELANQALHLANSEANTIALAGITLRYCCQPDRAIAHTRKAMQLCPLYPAWYPYGIAICHWMKHELDPAIEYIEKALEIDPDMALTYLVQAMIYAETGDDRKAREAVEAILRIDPKFSRVAFTQGLPFSDPAVQTRRERLLQKAAVPQ